MALDKESVGLSAASQERITDLEAKGWFGEAADIARFCMAYAMRAKVGVGSTEQVETRWAAGNFDKTGEIRALIRVLYPDCETPVRQMEHLVNEGLRMIHDLVSAGAGPAELLG